MRDRIDSHGDAKRLERRVESVERRSTVRNLCALKAGGHKDAVGHQRRAGSDDETRWTGQRRLDDLGRGWSECQFDRLGAERGMRGNQGNFSGVLRRTDPDGSGSTYEGEGIIADEVGRTSKR